MSQVNAIASPPTPQGGSGGIGTLLHNPRIMLFAAIGAGLLVFIWWRNRNSSSSSGYPVGQPSGLPSASGTTSGDPITSPPANTQAYNPIFKDVVGGSIACDSLVGCQFFPTPQGSSNAAGGTNTGQQPPPSTLSPSIVATLPPSPLPVPGPPSIPSLPPPPAPIIAARPIPAPAQPHPLPKQNNPIPIPVTVSHPHPSPSPTPKPAMPPSVSPGGAVLPLGASQLGSTLNTVAQKAINSLHLQPPPIHPPVPLTHSQVNTTKPKSPAIPPPHVKGGGPQTKRAV